MAASDIRDDWRVVLNRVEHDGDTITIVRYGKPIARIIPIEDQPQPQEETP